jgi:hypothetical protein
MDFARRAAARADAGDIYGMRIPSPDGNRNLELVLCLRLCGLNLEPVDCSCSQEKGDFFEPEKGNFGLSFGITGILLSFLLDTEEQLFFRA